ncbi:hypothetical protein BDM02DRAFT_2037784 [Thelephora ganbajun]|uniref:Uncharacterized protein n=1 Tax=Thelephora ganbajun TaxID=370292 RepID=A0ACB6ZGC0_THEGA|nr:hypothetical protein BDM02DRAFT_2037784 [Thelephora ganbajun]
MKGCLILNSASPHNSPRPPARKCVSFCGSGSNSSSSSDDEQELVEVHVADDWDRTPCEITPKLTYQDLLELHELKSSAVYPQYKPCPRPKPPQLLNRVPVGLLPLLSDTPSSPSKPPTTLNNGLKNTSSIDNTVLPNRPLFGQKLHSPAPLKANPTLASKFSFLPLMSVEDQSAGGHPGEMTQSPINPQSPGAPTNRLGNRFQFLPLLPLESTHLDSTLGSEPPSDDDHASPISTPSLTASSSLPSPPGTPSATSSPSLTPSSIPHLTAPDLDLSYFNLSRPPAGTNHKPDQLRLTEMDSRFSKLRLQALPCPNLMPSSGPFDLCGGKTRPNGEISEKLSDTGHLGRKGGRRRVVEYININGWTLRRALDLLHRMAFYHCMHTIGRLLSSSNLLSLPRHVGRHIF